MHLANACALAMQSFSSPFEKTSFDLKIALYLFLDAARWDLTGKHVRVMYTPLHPTFM